MIRRFLAREGQRLLQEFNAPDGRTLLLRAVFWVWLYGACGIVCGGLVAVYYLFGIPAMYGVVFLLYLLCVRLEARRPVYLDNWPFGPGRDPALPPPGKPALPPPGARALPPPSRRQIGRASSVLTRQQRRWP